MKKNNNRQIPQLSSSVEVRHRYRFQFSGLSQTTLAFSADDLIAIFGGLYTGGGSVRVSAKSAKIHSVEAWAPPPSVGSSATLSLKWQSNPGGGGPGVSSLREVSDTTLSTAFPLHILAKPPRQTLASFWLDYAAANEIFEMDVPVNTIIDIVMSHVIDDTGTPADTYSSTVGSPVNTYVWPAIVSHQLVPVSLSS
jgi:hypothetical protein